MSDKHYVHPPDETELAKLLRQSRSWFDVYGTTLIYGIAGILAIAAVVVYVRRTPPASAPASSALLAASKIGSMMGGSTTPEDYQDVADRFSESEIGIRARLRQGNLQLEKAINDMFSNRAAALVELDSAQKAFESLVDRKDLSSDVRARVLAGLARVAETQCDGSAAKTDAAIKAWERVLDLYKNVEGPKVFQSIAEERIADLKQESTKEFYAWFQQQTPKPKDDSLLPQDRPGSTVPEVPNAFELPNFSMPPAQPSAPLAPSFLTPELPSVTPSGDPSPTSPAPEQPAPAEPGSSEPVPSEPKPAEPAPAEEPQPAEPVPAEPKSEEPAPAEPAPTEPAPADAPKKTAE